jgi:hypothetical protein
VAQVPARRHAEQEIEVGLGEVAVEQDDARAQVTERDRQVDRDRALAHATLAARHRERAHRGPREVSEVLTRFVARLGPRRGGPSLRGLGRHEPQLGHEAISADASGPEWTVVEANRKARATFRVPERFQSTEVKRQGDKLLRRALRVT